jgi:hypothetical protein
LYNRSIQVDIQTDSDEVVDSMQIDVVPREMHCDQTFRYFEVENTKSDLRVPNFL